MEILRALTTDAPAIYKIGQRAFQGGENWTEGQYREAAAQDGSLLLKAEEDGAVIGFLQADLCCDDLHLNLIAVDDRARKSGVGSALMAHLLQVGYQQGGRIFSLEVRSQNAPAAALYRKFQLKNAGVRRRFYQNPPDDAVIYIKEIENLCTF